MNLPSSTATSSPSLSDALIFPDTCSDCGSKEKETWLIHTVRFRGTLRYFCTHCVLRNHPSSFCPACFFYFDSTPHASRRILCSKCNSMTHTNCLAADSKSERDTFLCPPCKDPDTFCFFRPIIGPNGARCIDEPLSEVFLCAAKIALFSMNKAVSWQRGDCDRRGREAALARKRAREQLEEVVVFDGKERVRSSKVKEAVSAVVEHKAKVLNGEKEKESQNKNNGGGGGGSEKQQSQGVPLAKVKQESGADGSK